MSCKDESCPFCKLVDLASDTESTVKELNHLVCRIIRDAQNGEINRKAVKGAKDEAARLLSQISKLDVWTGSNR